MRNQDDPVIADVENGNKMAKRKTETLKPMETSFGIRAQANKAKNDLPTISSPSILTCRDEEDIILDAADRVLKSRQLVETCDSNGRSTRQNARDFINESEFMYAEATVGANHLVVDRVKKVDINSKLVNLSTITRSNDE